MTKTLEMNGFTSLDDASLSELNGGIVFTAAFIGACVIWGVNASLLYWGIRDSLE